MPTYSFKCPGCGEPFSSTMTMADYADHGENIPCPAGCGGGPLRRVFDRVAINLAGFDAP